MASLYEAYLGAGLDPVQFWTQTPRRLLIQVRAARTREADRRAALAEAVWVGTHADAKGLAQYQATLRGQDTILPPEALAGALRAATVGLPVMTRADYLKQRS